MCVCVCADLSERWLCVSINQCPRSAHLLLLPPLPRRTRSVGRRHVNTHHFATGLQTLLPLTLPPHATHCSQPSSVQFFSRPRSEGWPHHGRTFSIYPCPLSFWLTLPQTVLSTSWCCPSRPCVVFLACVHLALYLALSLSPGNSFVSSWCDHSMLASLLWRCLTVLSLLQLC